MPQSWLPCFGVRVVVVLMDAVQHNPNLRRCISYTKCTHSPDAVRCVVTAKAQYNPKNGCYCASHSSGWNTRISASWFPRCGTARYNSFISAEKNEVRAPAREAIRSRDWQDS